MNNLHILVCGGGFPDICRLLQEPLIGDEIRVCAEGSVVGALPGVDVIIPAMSRITADHMDIGTFRLIQQWGTGIEGVDIEAAQQRGIWVANVPSRDTHHADSVAEHALLLILALMRNLPMAQSNVRSGLLGSPIGRTLADRTVCILGLGAIGCALARRLRPFGVRLIGISRHIRQKLSEELGLTAWLDRKSVV